MNHGANLAIRVQARARRNELVLRDDDVLLVRVSAPALDGRANKAVCRLIARHLHLAPSRVTIVRGERSREKLIHVEDVDQQTLRDAFRS